MRKKPKINYRDFVNTGRGTRDAERVPEAAAPAIAATHAEPEIPAPVDPLSPSPAVESSVVGQMPEGAAAEISHEARPGASLVPRAAPRSFRGRVEARGGSIDLLLFRVGAELFGVELAAVEEVLDLPALHRVPEMPQSLLGVFTLRGGLVALHAPDAVLGTSLRAPTSALVFHGDGRRLALAADDVDDVLTLKLAMLRDVPVSDGGDGVLAGVVRRGRDLIGVVDVDALVTQLRAGRAVEAA